MKKRLSLSLSLLMLCGLFLTACGQKPAEPSGGADGTAQKELETIVFTEPVRDSFWAPAYLAETLGYFKEAGLKAEFVTASGPDASAAVFSGDAQFGLRGIEMGLMANAAGQGCKILMSTTGLYPYQLIGVSPDYSTLDSLRGKVVAGGVGASSGPQAFSRACLSDAGLQPDVDVSVMSMPSSAYLSAIQAGEIQAAVATNPWIGKQLLDNGGVVLVDGTDPAYTERLMGTSNYELFMVFCSDAYIQSNPETVQKVVTAMTKAVKWMNTATAEEISESLAPLFAEKMDMMNYSVSYTKEHKIWTTDGYHTDSGYQAALDLTKLSGGITADIPASTVFDESFLDKAWAEIGK